MIKLLIASVPDRERVVVELWQGDTHLAEVSNEDGTFRVEFYTVPGMNSVALPLDELVQALLAARESCGRLAPDQSS